MSPHQMSSFVHESLLLEVVLLVLVPPPRVLLPSASASTAGVPVSVSAAGGGACSWLASWPPHLLPPAAWSSLAPIFPLIVLLSISNFVCNIILIAMTGRMIHELQLQYMTLTNPINPSRNSETKAYKSDTKPFTFT